MNLLLFILNCLFESCAFLYKRCVSVVLCYFLTRGEALPETGQIKCFVVCYYEVSISSTTLVSQGIFLLSG